MSDAAAFKKEGDHTSANIRLALYIAWVAFLVSFFLPAIGPPEAPSAGWQAFRCLEIMCHPLLVLAMPSVLVVVPTIFIGNVAAALAPLGLVDKSLAGVVAALTAAGAVCGLWLPAAFELEMLEGYYLWILSLFGLAIVEAIVALHVGSTE